nr:photosystem II protein D1 [Solanum cajanumense]UNZ90323.1 photosystem II protein D1 [Solanum cajanumense]
MTAIFRERRKRKPMGSLL